MRKTLVVFIALLMILSLVPATVMAEDVKYPLWVGDVQVSSDVHSGEGWSFDGDASGGTLTLDGASISASTPIAPYFENKANIRIEENTAFDLQIYVSGNNTLSAPGNGYGIYVYSEDASKNSLTITGPGKLTVSGAGWGISVTSGDPFWIDKTTISVEAKSTGIVADDITISDSDVTVYGRSYGLSCDSLTISDSNVSSEGGDGVGIYCIEEKGLKVSGDSYVDVIGKTDTQSEPGAIYCCNVELGEDVEVMGPEGVSIERESENGSYRAYKEDGSLATEVIIGRAYPLWVGEGQVTTENMKDLTVIGGVKAAEGGKVSFRIEKDSETGDKKNILTLDNATIDGLHNSNGMNKSITFEKMDLTIEVSGESRVGSENNGDGIQSNSYGIQSNGTLTFEGDGSVSISGSSTGINAFGNDVIINGGDVSAIGKVYGLYAVCKTTYDIDNGEYIDHGGFVTVNAGSLNAVSTDTVTSCEAINVRKLTVNGGKLTAETRNEELVIYDNKISAIVSRDVPALGEGIYIISPQNGEFVQFRVYNSDQYLITDGENRVGNAVIGPAGKIVFQNYDGAVLQSSTVGIGEIPVYEGDEPEKDPDAQYTYKFAGWDTEPVAVTGDATYTAKYDSFLREYTVTFENYDKTVLQSGKVKYGDIPTYSGKEPVKPEDEKYTYSFDGWTPSVVKVTGEARYTAVFKATEKEPVYTVTEGADGSWTKGSGEDFRITVKRSFDDDECFSHFAGVSVDGKALEKSAYTAVNGSTVVTLGADALEQLSEGGHTVTVEFDDGEAETEITVKPEEKKDDVPDTGTEDHMVLFTVISFISAVSLGAVLTLKKELLGYK